MIESKKTERIYLLCLIMLVMRIHMNLLFPFVVGIVPPRTKSPTDESHSSSAGVSWPNDRVPNGISRVSQLKVYVNNIKITI